MKELKKIYLNELNRRYLKATSNLRHINKCLKESKYYKTTSRVKQCIDIHTERYNDYTGYYYNTLKKINEIIEKSEIEVEKAKYSESLLNIKDPIHDLSIIKVLFEPNSKKEKIIKEKTL